MHLLKLITYDVFDSALKFKNKTHKRKLNIRQRNDEELAWPHVSDKKSLTGLFLSQVSLGDVLSCASFYQYMLSNKFNNIMYCLLITKELPDNRITR